MNEQITMGAYRDYSNSCCQAETYRGKDLGENEAGESRQERRKGGRKGGRKIDKDVTCIQSVQILI